MALAGCASRICAGVIRGTVLLRRRHVYRFGSDLINVRRDVGIDSAQGPIDSTEEHRLENGISPDILAMSHVGVEHAAFAIKPGPGRWIRRPLVHIALH